jgi:hypothetical protein
MKKILLILGLIAAILLTSCQKEIDWGLGNSTPLLIKSVQKTGSDSVVITYFYDGAQRLVLEETEGISQGINVGNELQIIRNGSGIITKTIQKGEVMLAAGIDSVVTIYHYSTSASRYTSAVFDLTIFGFSVTDSADFKYDASGNIISQDHYQKMAPLPPILTFKLEYNYTAANLSSIKQYAIDPITMGVDLLATLNYTYDTKSTPLKMDKEGIILNRPAFYGKNNATKTEFVDAADPANNFTDIIAYTYNSTGRPLTAVSTQTPAGTVSNISYYYQ